MHTTSINSHLEPPFIHSGGLLDRHNIVWETERNVSDFYHKRLVLAWGRNVGEAQSSAGRKLTVYAQRNAPVGQTASQTPQ